MTRLGDLWRLLPSPTRRALFSLAALSLAAALAELGTFAALAAFLSELTAPRAGLVRLASLFAITALVAAVVRLWLAAKTNTVTADVTHHLNVETQRHLIHQPLEFHARFNSARALSMIDKVNAIGSQVFAPAARLSQSIVIGGALIVALAVKTPAAAIAVSAIIGLVYLAIARAGWRRIRDLQSIMSEAYDRRVQSVQENMAGIRDIILDSLQDRRVAEFAASDGELQRRLAAIQNLALVPRLAIEGFGMACFALLAILLSARGLDSMIPALGLVGFVAMRLLPLAQSAYMSWQSWNASQSIVDEVRAVLRLPVPPMPSGLDPLPLRREIRLDAVSFAYPGGPAILNDLSLVLPRGSRTGLFGPTGSGKSTLGDLLMALQSPTSGKLWVDGTDVAEHVSRWQAGIAHVGQQLFLLDATIADNVAFGDPAPDRARISDAIRRACLDDYLERLDDMVGERGVRMSGGQRQRLGLARAFYKRAPFLLLDEATNALDPSTEARVLSNIDADATVLIIGHRPSALAICDRVFEMHGGKLVAR